MRLVLATGVFDLLHVSHVRYLAAAAAMGTRLVVGMTADMGVGKPGRPIIPGDERYEILCALACVDMVIVTPSALNALRQITPHVWARGHEYRSLGNLPAEDAFCAEHGVTIRYTPESEQSTTAIIARVRACM